jgi:hypothetical protein
MVCAELACICLVRKLVLTETARFRDVDLKKLQDYKDAIDKMTSAFVQVSRGYRSSAFQSVVAQFGGTAADATPYQSYAGRA